MYEKGRVPDPWFNHGCRLSTCRRFSLLDDHRRSGRDEGLAGAVRGIVVKEDVEGCTFAIPKQQQDIRKDENSPLKVVGFLFLRQAGTEDGGEVLEFFAAPGSPEIASVHPPIC